jgi:hypothetical protein
MEWSTPAIVDGDDEEFAITDDLPRKGSTKFALHTAPLDAQLCQDDLHLQALLGEVRGGLNRQVRLRLRGQKLVVDDG